MISLIMHFQDVPELQSFLEKFPESKKYMALKDNRPGVRKNSKWTEIEDEHICSTYLTKSAKAIAQDLHRTKSAISARIFQLQRKGIIRQKTKRNGKVYETAFVE